MNIETRYCKTCGKEISNLKYCSLRCQGKDPAQREKSRQNALKGWATPGHREEVSLKISINNKKIFNTPERKEFAKRKAIKQFSSPEARKKCSDRVIEKFKVPEEHIKRSEEQKRLWEDQAYRDRLIEGAKRGWKDPERHKKQSDIQKSLWEKPEHAKKMLSRRNKSAPEILMEKIINDNNFPFYFNGYAQNGSPLIVGRKVPEFVHHTELKLIAVSFKMWIWHKITDKIKYYTIYRKFDKDEIHYSIE